MSSSWYERLVGIPGVGKVPREVLVIDDHPEAREMIIALLARLGWKTRQAADGAEAVGVMKAGHAEIGLALVDVILPDTDGMSLARQLRDEYPRLAIVLLSGQLNDESRWIVSDEGFRFLPKPFSLPQLRDVVAEMLGDPDAPDPV
ncbi:MAG: response regulator [Rariglobus sp.]|nr:response regulator [Rariglobus sp.]